jgi:hypothetical protein
MNMMSKTVAAPKQRDRINKKLIQLGEAAMAMLD